MATRQLRVEIVGDPRRIIRTFDSIEKSTARFARGFSRATTLVGAGLAAMAGGAVVGAIKSMVDEARDAEKVGRQTAAVIKATGGVAKVSAKDVDRLADALSNKVGVDDEIIAAGQNMLLTFKNVRNEAGRQNDIFNQTTRVALDMTAALNQGEISQSGLEQTTMRLGKALNDPIKGISALTRVGVTFTEKQKEQIRILVESGRTMDAQKIILKELASEFGGAAEAAADPWQRVGVAFDNVKEKIGTALLPALNNAATFITDKLIPAAEKWWRDHGPKVRDVFGDIAGFIGDTWTVIRDDLLPALKDMADQIVQKMLPGLEDTAAAWRDNSEAIKALGDDFKDLKPLWDFLLFVIHKISTEEIPGFINQIGWIGRAWQAVRKPVLTAVHLMVREVLAGFGQILHGAAAAFGWVPGVGEKLKTARDAFDRFQQDVNEQFRQIISGKTINLKVKGTFQPPPGFSMHSIVGRAAGGPISGPGTSTSDSVPAMLSAGEFVVNAAQTARHRELLEAINAGRLGRMAAGGVVVRPSLPSAAGLAQAGEVAALRIADMIARNVKLTVPITVALGGIGGLSGSASRSRSIVHGVFSGMFGWTGAQLAAADQLIMRESGYRNTAQNPTSTAFGLFQFLNSTWASTGIRKTADAFWQAVAGGRYIRSRYGSPIGAWNFWQGHHWYDQGGFLPPGVSVAVNRTGRPERVLAPGEGAGITVNFYGPVYGDRRALTEVVRQTWKEQMRREGKGALAAQL